MGIGLVGCRLGGCLGLVAGCLRFVAWWLWIWQCCVHFVWFGCYNCCYWWVCYAVSFVVWLLIVLVLHTAYLLFGLRCCVS